MFNQEILSCDHPGKVNCANSPQFYEANTELGKPGAEPASQPAQSGSKGSSAPAPAPRQQQPRPRVQQPSKVRWWQLMTVIQQVWIKTILTLPPHRRVSRDQLQHQNSSRNRSKRSQKRRLRKTSQKRRLPQLHDQRQHHSRDQNRRPAHQSPDHSPYRSLKKRQRLRKRRSFSPT